MHYPIHFVTPDERHVGAADRLGNLPMQAFVIRTVYIEQPFVWLSVNYEEVIHDFVEVAELAPTDRYLLCRHEPNNAVLLIDSDLPCKQSFFAEQLVNGIGVPLKLLCPIDDRAHFGL